MTNNQQSHCISKNLKSVVNWGVGVVLLQNQNVTIVQGSEVDGCRTSAMESTQL